MSKDTERKIVIGRPKALPTVDRPERSPKQILAALVNNFDEIYRRKKSIGETENGFWKNWYAGVGNCLYELRKENLIPEDAIQETDDFLEARLSPGFAQEMAERRKPTKDLIHRVLRRELVEAYKP